MLSDFYDVLGVPRHATPDEINISYLLKLKLSDPQFRRGGCYSLKDLSPEARLAAIENAWCVLSYPEERKRYDAENPDAGKACYSPPATET